MKIELRQYDTNNIAYVPQFEIFDGVDGIKNIYQDMLKTIKKNTILVIKFFASNTFNSQVMKNKVYSDFHIDFFDEMIKICMMVDAYIGNGIFVMENIDKISDLNEIKKIVPGDGATHGYLIGKTMYMLQFR